MKNNQDRLLNVALIQPNGSNQVSANIDQLQQLMAQVDRNTQLVCLPECANLVERDPKVSRQLWAHEADDPYLAACVQQSIERGCYIQIGSLVIKDPQSDKAINRGYVIAPNGQIIARYDKCHLFDVELPDGSSYKESNTFCAGNRLTKVQTPHGLWGLSICFDLRFSSVYQYYKRCGVALIFVPAAFTRSTGRAHWEVLLRARAIETQAFIIAAAQVGQHQDGRATYGHSMVIDPWGDIVDQLRAEVGVLNTCIDLNRVAEVRASMPLKSVAFDA